MVPSTPWEKEHLPNQETVPVKIKFDENSTEYWDSLIDLYNDWYMQYYNVTTYPRLIVRFEDLLFMPEELLKIIAECITGGDTLRRRKLRHALRKQIKLQVGASKSHGESNDLVRAVIKYGNGFGRASNLTADDLNYTIRALSSQPLMDTFDYQMLPGVELQGGGSNVAFGRRSDKRTEVS